MKYLSLLCLIITGLNSSIGQSFERPDRHEIRVNYGPTSLGFQSVKLLAEGLVCSRFDEDNEIEYQFYQKTDLDTDKIYKLNKKSIDFFKHYPSLKIRKGG
jgi:hypothetical protein